MTENNSKDDYMVDVIVIGAGPAGLSAALSLLRGGVSVLILEARNYGGQIINSPNVENYPGIPSISGYDFATNLYNQVIALGGKIKYEEVLNVTKEKEVITNKGKYQSKAIIIATGAKNRQLNLPKEEEFVGNGISYCAICDGNFYKNKIVAVNGGGNTALEDALYLADIAQKVYLIHRRDTFKGDNKYLEELKKKKNVEFILNTNIIALNGNTKLESITIKDNDGNMQDITLDGLFIAIGQVPQNDIFKDVALLDENGYIMAKDEVYTKTPGIFVAGDARVKDLRQLTTATSDGAIAAMMAIREMKGND